jgi:hypothetical protein
VNNIARDISMGGFVTEEHAISRAQYLDLVYLQTGTLYDLLPNTPRPSTSATSTTPAASHASDGLIGTFHAQPHSIHTSNNNSKSIYSNVQNALSPTSPTSKTSEVNSIQSTTARKNKFKIGKGKNKEDKNNPQTEKTKTPHVDDRDKHKPRYPYVICGVDHYTKDCPRGVEVTKIFQGTQKPPTLVVLSQPFPSNQ